MLYYGINTLETIFYCYELKTIVYYYITPLPKSESYFLVLWQKLIFIVIEYLFWKLFFYYYEISILKDKTIFYCYKTLILIFLLLLIVKGENYYLLL